MSVTVRPACAGDIAQIAELEREIFSLPWSQADFHNELQQEGSVFLSACDGRTVSGFVVLRLFDTAGEVYNIAVSPALRRRGAGRALLAAALSAAEEQGMLECTLEVRASNEAAINLYKSFGFQPVAVRRGYYSKPTEDGILMLRTKDST